MCQCVLNALLIQRRHVEIFSSDTCTCLITRQVSPTLKRLVQYRFSIMSFQWIYKQLGIPVVLIIDHKKKQQQKSAKHQKWMGKSKHAIHKTAMKNDETAPTPKSH